MRFPPDSPLGRLTACFPRPGRVRWIGLRPGRGSAMQAVDTSEAILGGGLRGDRFRGASGKRGITLIQFEHLATIAILAGRDAVDASLLRRNVVVERVPLAALVGRRFTLGAALLEGTGPCDPCSQMEAALGPGGYNAMRGLGGITARVLAGGTIALGDALHAQPDSPNPALAAN